MLNSKHSEENFEGFTAIECFRWLVYLYYLGQHYTTWSCMILERRRPDAALNYLLERYNITALKYISGRFSITVDCSRHYMYMYRYICLLQTDTLW